MYFAYSIIGLIAGAFLAGAGGHGLLAVIAGTAIGALLARVVKLERRVRRLESSTQRDDVSSRAKTPEPVTPKPDTQKTQSSDVTGKTLSWEEPEELAGSVISSATSGEQASQTPEPEISHPPPTASPSPLQVFFSKVASWFTSGNVPVKVGVIISFFGVAFLLKYAIERDLLYISLQVRLLAVAAAGLALLAIGWRLRKKDRTYALSLQGGGAGILFLTIFAALQLWQMLPAALAFFLLVALTVLTGALAVQQNSRSLAMLGVIGGFLAPVLASTGQGNHVVLFSYYLLLNSAILGIAWFRAWQGLNLVGWAFTFLIGSLWGYQYYKPELLASTLPFLLAHFLFYQAIAILFALRQPPSRIGVVDGTLVFGTPIIVFALQAALVEGIDNALAISAASVAVFYALTAAWLWRSRGEALRLLSESYVVLAVAFATITIPLYFDARWTAAAWAVEGAALIWLGTRQTRQLPKLAGTLLVFFSGLAFMDSGWHHDAGLPILNGNVLGGLLISISAFYTSRKLEVFDTSSFKAMQVLASKALFTWGVLWWLGTGWMEVVDRADLFNSPGSHNRSVVFLLFVSLSSALAAWLGSQYQWARARRATLLLLAIFVPVAWLGLENHGHFLRGPGWLVWPLAWAVQLYVLRKMDEYDDRGAASWHLGSLLMLSAGLALEASWWIDRFASDAWAGATAASIMGMIALLVWRFAQRPSWPVPVHPQTYLAGSLLLLGAQVLLLLVLALNMPGDAAPWRYIPVFNPFDLAMLLAMLVAIRGVAQMSASAEAGHSRLTASQSVFRLLLAAAFFVLTTMALIRGVHHFAAVAWHTDALFDSTTVQASLSIYWGLLGFIGMVWGARRSQRVIWLTGAGFMALVVIKLFIVDLGNTGTLARIVSFIGIGGLLLVVGYFAPAPPKSNH